MKRWALWGGSFVAVVAVLVIALAALARYRPDLVMLRLAPVIRSLKEPVGPPHPITWQQGPATASKPADKRPPNIIFILADDLGWNGVSRNGGIANGAVPTPSIDSIASHGAAFTNGYAGNAVCAPSRAALMTGRYATRFGFEFTPTPDAMIPAVDSMMQHNPHFLRKPLQLPHGKTPAFDSLGMPTSEITIAQLLQKAGYHTVHIGKWHLGEVGQYQPVKRGFDESLQLAGLLHGPKDDPGIVNARLGAFDPIDKFLWAIGREAVRFNGGSRFSPNKYLADYFTDQAVRVIHANRNRPFFLYLAHWSVHTPLQATRADYDALPQIKDHSERVYAAMIRALDRSVSRVLQALKQNGLLENTLVVFTSDNGAPGYMGLPDVNTPYRGWKLTYFEGGLHVPFYMQWPARIPADEQFTAPVHGVDIFPTIANAAHAPLPTDRKLDGVNLLPYINGNKTGAPHKTLFWRDGDYLALIDSPWKLQVAQRLQKTWLFNLHTDPTEQHNVAEAHPDIVARLKDKLEKINAQQAKPLWQPAIAFPVDIDKTAAAPETPDDNYIYWTN